MSIALTTTYKNSLASPYQTKCTAWFIKLADGTILGFTDLDRDVKYNLESFLSSAGRPIAEVTGSGLITYTAKTGYTRTDIASADDLSVDNLEIDGMISAPSIIEDDLRKGRWDTAFCMVFQLDWMDLSNTMGVLILRVGKLGEVTLQRDTFIAELRGKCQAYTRTLGELTSPGCRAELFDARCKVNPATYTVTGTLTAVSASKLVFTDTARTEPGPTGAVAILGITNANPGVVHVVNIASLLNGMPITIAGVVGPDLLNNVTIIRNRNLAANTFELGVDTSNTGIYPPWTAGGTVTPLGLEAGTFGFGVMTMTSGVANGLKMEVSAYVPKQWIIALPFADGLLTPSAGDTYSMTYGCDKSLGRCLFYNNVANMRAEPYLPGLDKIVQVGKQPAGA